MSKHTKDSDKGSVPSLSRRKFLQMFGIGTAVVAGGAAFDLARRFTGAKESEAQPELSRKSRLIQFLAEQTTQQENNPDFEPPLPQIVLAEWELLPDFVQSNALTFFTLDIQTEGNHTVFLLQRNKLPAPEVTPQLPESFPVQYTGADNPEDNSYLFSVTSTDVSSPLVNKLAEMFGDAVRDGSHIALDREELLAVLANFSPEFIQGELQDAGFLSTALHLVKSQQTVGSELVKTYQRTVAPLWSLFVDRLSHDLSTLSAETPISIATDVKMIFSSESAPSPASNNSFTETVEPETILEISFPESNDPQKLIIQTSGGQVAARELTELSKEEFYLSAPGENLQEVRAVIQETQTALTSFALESAAVPQMPRTQIA